MIAILERVGRRVAARREGWLCMVVVVLETGLLGSLLLEHRFPRVHDGYQYFSLQYVFFNGAVTAGEIPQWSPAMTHGVVATWWYAYTTALLDHALFPIAPLLKSVNFLWIFYLAMWVNELVLLVGTWLLARRFFDSIISVFFVTVSVVLTSIWMSQPLWNFNFYYALPLTLHLLHEFLARGRWGYLVMASNLLVFHALAAHYALPAITFMVFLYMASWLAIHPDGWRQVVGLRFGWAAVGGLALSAASGLLGLGIITAGIGEIVTYSPTRGVYNRVPLDVFLTYGGALNNLKWRELLIRISPAFDYTLYSGMLVVPFATLGVAFNLRRRNAHLAVALILTYLFGIGSALTVAAYHVWPMMAYFRHIGLTACVPKLLLCFLAGLGVDRLLQASRGRVQDRLFALGLAATAAAMAYVSVRLFVLAEAKDVGLRVKEIVARTGEAWGPILTVPHIRSALVQAAVLAAVAALLLVGMTSRRLRGALLALAMVLAVVDVAGYKAATARIVAFPLWRSEYDALAFGPIPWVPRRCDAMPCRASARWDAVGPWPMMTSWTYWTTPAFVYEEELGSSTLVGYWLRPLDDLMRAYWGQPLGNPLIWPRGLDQAQRLHFPEQPAAAKLAAGSEDKVQVFSTAFLIPELKTVAGEISKPAYTGDVLFVTPPPGRAALTTSATAWPDERSQPASHRRHFPYRVERFSANHLEVTVDVGAEPSAWLMYSDVWHPSWQATVNGRATPVFKANLAYKAVPLAPGTNRVHFRFAIPGLSLLQLALSLCALAWVGWLASWFVTIWRPDARPLAWPQKPPTSRPRPR